MPFQAICYRHLKETYIYLKFPVGKPCTRWFMRQWWMTLTNWETVFTAPVLGSFRKLARCDVPFTHSLLAMLGSEDTPVLPVWDHYFSGPCCYLFLWLSRTLKLLHIQADFRGKLCSSLGGATGANKVKTEELWTLEPPVQQLNPSQAIWR